MSAKPPRPPGSDHEQELLDEALDESFPASDPASLVQPDGGISGPEEVLRQGDALIVVDVQIDFCPGGALPINEGDTVVPVLNRWIAKAERLGIPIFASRDWHPKNHLSFKPQGGEGPVHCVQGTGGAAFHPDLFVPADATIITKGDRSNRDQYSAFDATGLADALRRRDVSRVFVGGLAEDVCVRATALDAVKSDFETHLISGATKPVTQAGGVAARKEMQKAGVVFD